MNRLLCWLIAGMIVSGCSESIFYRAKESDFEAWVESMRGPSEGKTVQNISEWMHAHMKYEDDGLFDYFKPWERSWNQTGDCEDHALVACEALTRLGFKDYRIVSVFNATRGHAVCSNGVYFLGNWYPHTYVGAEGDWRKVADGVYNDWNKITVRDVNLNVVERIVK